MANNHCRLISQAALSHWGRKIILVFSSKIENPPKEVMLGLFTARKRKTLGTVWRNVCRNAFLNVSAEEFYIPHQKTCLIWTFSSSASQTNRERSVAPGRFCFSVRLDQGMAASSWVCDICKILGKKYKHVMKLLFEHSNKSLGWGVLHIVGVCVYVNKNSTSP